MLLLVRTQLSLANLIFKFHFCKWFWKECTYSQPLLVYSNFLIKISKNLILIDDFCDETCIMFRKSLPAMKIGLYQSWLINLLYQTLFAATDHAECGKSWFLLFKLLVISILLEQVSKGLSVSLLASCTSFGHAFNSSSLTWLESYWNFNKFISKYFNLSWMFRWWLLL